MTIRRQQALSTPHAAGLYGMIRAMQSQFLSQSDYQVAAGERLRTVIQLLDLSFTDAAEIMGISKHVLNFWMRGDNPIQPYPLYRLCRAKGINFDYVALGDWSALPHWVARKIEERLEEKLESVGGSGQRGRGSDKREDKA